MSSWFNALRQSYNKNKVLDHSTILSVAAMVNSCPTIH